MRGRAACAAATVILAFAVALVPAAIAGAEEVRDGYFTVYCEGREILHTGRVLHPGDQFIDEDDRHYEIFQVEELRAYARYLGNVAPDPPSGESLLPEMDAEFRLWEVFEAEEEDEELIVGIYHTHSAESFVPTSGKPSREGQGDVMQVGETMAEALEEHGFVAKHDTTVHDPHDAGAYTRSRRTAVSMLQQGPKVLFDLHRDTGPADAYLAEIDGEEVARVLLVVGRANPHMDANLSFAQSLKAQADENYPGLVKGILKASGDYNQDLGPRALLLEVGSVEISLEQAEMGGELLAEVLGGKMVADEGEDRAAGRSALWLIVVVFLAGGLFLWISTGSWEEARARLGQYLPWDTGGRAK